VGYGVLLTVLGIFDGQEEIDRAAGVNLNLFGGLWMLVFGILMLVWAFSRPLAEELASDEGGGGPGGDRHSAGGGGDAGR
jgi:hypothetical protein